MVVGFHDGTQVAGVFAERSLGLTSPQPPGVFLEQEWVINDTGDVVYERPGTAGILIPNLAEVRWVRLLHAGGEPEVMVGSEAVDGAG